MIRSCISNYWGISTPYGHINYIFIPDSGTRVIGVSNKGKMINQSLFLTADPPNQLDPENVPFETKYVIRILFQRVPDSVTRKQEPIVVSLNRSISIYLYIYLSIYQSIY